MSDVRIEPIIVDGDRDHVLRPAFEGIGLARMHNKPLVVVTLRGEGVAIRLSVKAYDRDNGAEWGFADTRVLTVEDFAYDADGARSRALKEIQTLLKSALCHEVDECIREADGSRPFEPHQNVKPEDARQ